MPKQTTYNFRDEQIIQCGVYLYFNLIIRKKMNFSVKAKKKQQIKLNIQQLKQFKNTTVYKNLFFEWKLGIIKAINLNRFLYIIRHIIFINERLLYNKQMGLGLVYKKEITQIKEQVNEKVITTCYNNHVLKNWKIYLGGSSYGQHCNQCSKQRNVLLVCQQCNYKICPKCSHNRHIHNCQKHIMSFSHTNYCSYCQFQKKALLVCLTCNIHICYQCEQFKHSNVCDKEKFIFSDKSQSLCNFCGLSCESYMNCENCKMKICNACRKSKQWK